MECYLHLQTTKEELLDAVVHESYSLLVFMDSEEASAPSQCRSHAIENPGFRQRTLAQGAL